MTVLLVCQSGTKQKEERVLKERRNKGEEKLEFREKQRERRHERETAIIPTRGVLHATTEQVLRKRRIKVESGV